MAEKFYVTTPIYYPNDVPHLGHAYTTIAADVLNRWYKLNKYKTFFLTGTDEHGKKIANTAGGKGKAPKEFTDELIPEFKSAWKKLNIKYDRFIRTTDEDHEKTVKKILQKVYDAGDIYKGQYEGYYCTSCEAYYTEKDAPNLRCPIHDTHLEKIKEESYFFKLSKYQNFLLDLYKKNPEFISPKNRRKEIINRVKQGLKDLSISRASFGWGIPLPFDSSHVTYVWFDALLNYYSATQNKKELNKFWPADTHIIGKDIIWFHTVYWPAMLKSANLKLPKKIFAHGWWTIKSKKMGKSAGNALKIDSLIKIAGTDSARYFLLRETSFGDDGDFSEEMLIERHNNELADKLGNLISRVSALAEKYGIEKTKLKSLDEKTKKDFGKLIIEKPINPKKSFSYGLVYDKKGKNPKQINTLNELLEALNIQINNLLENLEFDKALSQIFLSIDSCNTCIQNKKPWETKDKKVLYELANAIKDIAILLFPFMPETSEKIAKTFNFKISLEELNKPSETGKIKKSPILFEKIK